jgi:hypothetical protein
VPVVRWLVSPARIPRRRLTERRDRAPAYQGALLVPEGFSPETQELLDRAQRAIDEAAALREMSHRRLSDAERQTFMLALMSYRERAQQAGKE